MWRGNVLRVRKCSSATARRNTRWYSSQSSLPITNGEFSKALREIDGSLRLSRSNDHGQRLGFAISGGVDSMALAALYAGVRSSQEFESKSKAYAFIVDHKVRAESSEEAEWVAEQCRSKFGMEASVLPLSWPVGFDPLDDKRFETDARILRYQALGRACRAAGIWKLLVAHHADDQAETVLMRLANNRLRSGLQAMQPVEWIPECHGIHGVSHSGVYRSNRVDPLLKNIPFPVEDGGVRILRPLLGFDKSRLIATCEHRGVAWAEDKTNHLQTYTSRNAIRHILKNHELPAALGIRSLVEVSLRMQKRVNWHKAQADRLLRKCLKQLHLQTGSLFVRFPPFQDLLDRPIDTQSDMNEAKNNAHYLLARVGQLISPRETPPLGELAATVGNIWPEFVKLEDTDPSQVGFKGNRINYCIYGIWWRKWDKPSPFERHSQKLDGSRRPHINEWLLSRQPLEHHRTGASSITIHYPPSHTTALAPNSGEIDAYQLFDGRWWISIQNRSADVLTLRLFTKEDLARIPSLHVTKRNGSYAEDFISIALSILKPADLRYTLPAVFRRDKITGEETLVGFPTLGVSMGQLGFRTDVCSWRVRYKKIELSTEQLGVSVVPDVMHARIRKAIAKFDGDVMSPTIVSRERNVTEGNTVENRTGKRPARTAAVPMRRQTNRDQAKQNSDKVGSKKISRSQGDSISLLPVPESHRHGRAEKRDGGGYNIRWQEFKDRFS